MEFFYEHVHFNFAGNYLLALNFAEQAKKILPGWITNQDRGNWASAELCDARLAATVWDRQRVWQPILSRIMSPPFTGQFNHAANLKVYEAKMAEAKSLMNTQSTRASQQMYERAVDAGSGRLLFAWKFSKISGNARLLAASHHRSQTLLRTGSHNCRGDIIMSAHCWFAQENQLKQPNIFHARWPSATTMRKRKTPWARFWRTSKNQPRPLAGLSARSGPIQVCGILSQSGFPSAKSRRK